MFNTIIDPKNLLDAFEKTSRGKNKTAMVLFFKKNLIKNIVSLREKIQNGTYCHGKYAFFKVFDQKEREISAPLFVDRIVHHALHQVIEPIFEKDFIFDSYANRRGKGSHKAVARLRFFLAKAERERERERV